MVNQKLITIGIPVLNEELNIPILISRLNPVIEEIGRRGLKIEVLVNNNASSDESGKLLDSWANVCMVLERARWPNLECNK